MVNKNDPQILGNLLLKIEINAQEVSAHSLHNNLPYDEVKEFKRKNCNNIMYTFSVAAGAMVAMSFRCRNPHECNYCNEERRKTAYESLLYSIRNQPVLASGVGVLVVSGDYTALARKLTGKNYSRISYEKADYLVVSPENAAKYADHKGVSQVLIAQTPDAYNEIAKLVANQPPGKRLSGRLINFTHKVEEEDGEEGFYFKQQAYYLSPSVWTDEKREVAFKRIVEIYKSLNIEEDLKAATTQEEVDELSYLIDKLVCSVLKEGFYRIHPITKKIVW